MKSLEVKLNDGSMLTIRHSFRTFVLFEAYRFKTIQSIDTTEDMLYWLYCTLKGCNRETFTMDFEAFIDVLDENPQLFDEFNRFNAMADDMPVEPTIEPVNENETEDLKKRIEP